MSIAPVAGAAVYGAGASNPSATLGAAVAVNNLIVAYVRSNNNPAPASPGVVDNVNAGAYTLLNSIEDTTNSVWLSIWVKPVTTAGTPTISTSGLGYGNVAATAFGGFAGVPTVDATPNGSAQVTTATAAAFSVSPVDNAHLQTLLLGLTAQGSNNASVPAGWAKISTGGGNLQGWYGVVAAAGSNTPFAASLGTTTWYDAITAGVYDAGAVAAPTVTTVNGGQPIKEGAIGVALVGTNFVAPMTVSILQNGNTVAQANVDVLSATSATFDAVLEPGSGAQLKFDSAGASTTLKAAITGATSAAVACALAPRNGLIYADVASVNSSSTSDIQANPALAVGDQIEASGSADGTAAAPTGLQLNSDTTFQWPNGDTPQNFYARAWDHTDSTWGAWELQTVTSGGGGGSKRGPYRLFRVSTRYH